MAVSERSFVNVLAEAVHAMQLPVSDWGYHLLERYHQQMVVLTERQGVDLFPYMEDEDKVRLVYGGAMLAFSNADIHPSGRIFDLTETGGVMGMVFKAMLPELEVAISTPSPVEERVVSTTVERLGVEGVSVVRKWLDSDPEEMKPFEVVAIPSVLPPEQTLERAVLFCQDGGRVVLWGTGIDTVKWQRLGEEFELDLETYEHQYVHADGPIIGILRPMLPVAPV